MRLVSQDGTVDVPYEKSAIYCSDGRISALFNDRCLAMAGYSSIKKCEKAMSMLIEGCSEQFLFTIFQFPKDEEIEV